ncbi:MAG: ABC transporter substrate-binding protein [Treponema sp.]|jgi:NitT/TauT family transport system substrate-binding protein|nr:ABC transporter substrate-binding protein [Treponema sp.]
MKKWFFMFLMVCLTLSMVMATGSRDKGTSDADHTFVIGYGVTGGLCAAPFYIAEAKGYYEAEGLKWEKFNIEPGTALNLLTSGQIDGTYQLLATLIQPIANGLDVKIPLGLHTGCIKVMVSPDSPIQNPADLKGKKIGVSGLATSTAVIPKRYLAELGFKVEGENADVEFVVYPSAELPLALERGLVDAIGTEDPTATITENAGKGRVIINSATDDYLRDEFCCVTPIRSEAVKKYPESSAKFVRAIQKAAKFVQENPEETARILADNHYVAGEAVVNAQILRTFNYRASVPEAHTAINRNARDLQRIGLLDTGVDVNALVENTFIALPGVPDSLFK